MLDGPGARLVRLRRSAGFETATDAAKALGIAAVTYIHHESGARGISRQAADRYATFFGVAPGLILYGEAAPPEPRRIPVVGVVGLHGRIEPRMAYAATVPDTVAGPPGADAELQSLVVVEDDLAPAYRKGDVVFYAAPASQAECTRLAHGRECVVETADGARLLSLAEPDGEGTWTLRTYRGRPMRRVRLRALSPVLWVQRAAVPLPH